MHIEPGFVAPAKVMFANVATVGVLGLYAREMLRKPSDAVKTVLAATFFSLFMRVSFSW